MAISVGHVTFDNVSYDARADVLYLSIGEPREPHHQDVTPEGHVVRFDEHDRVIGLTVVNAKWIADRDGRIVIPMPIVADDLALALA